MTEIVTKEIKNFGDGEVAFEIKVKLTIYVRDTNIGQVTDSIRKAIAPFAI